MLIRREVLAAVLPALNDLDPARPSLSKVQILPTGEARATNGHIAIMASGIDGFRFSDGDFPVVPGAPFHESPTTPILVDEQTIKRLIGATQKGARSFPVLNCIQIGKNGTDTAHLLAATDLHAPLTATVQTDPQEQYPDLAKITPAADKADTVPLVLGVPVLEALLKAAKAIAGSKRMQTIRFDVPIGSGDRRVFRGPNDAPEELHEITGAIRATAYGPDAKIVAVVMPCRL